MNLSAFYYVTEVARCGSINKAAQNLFTSQSNMSASIKMLEKNLGYKLFERTSRGVTPTPEGHLFIQSANAILAEMKKIKEIPARVDAEETISISCNWSAQILQALMNFKAKDSREINDAYRETSILQNFECLYENKYRIAIIDCFSSFTDMEIQNARNTNLDVEILQKNVPAVALVSKNHPLAQKEKVTVNDVYKYPLVLFEDYRDVKRHQIMGITSRTPILYLYDRGGIIDALDSIDRVAILKRGTFVENEKHALAEFEIAGFPVTYDVLLMKRSYYKLNSREEAFLRYLKKNIYSK